MFDLLEESLLSQKPDEKPKQQLEANTSEAVLEPMVTTMPERFRIKQKKPFSLPLVLVGGFLLLTSLVGGVLLVVFSKPKLQVSPQISSPQVVPSSNVSTPAVTSSEAFFIQTPTSTPAAVENVSVTTTKSVLGDTVTSSEAHATSTSSLSVPASDEHSTSTPLVMLSASDADSDGLTDSEERLYGTDAESKDTDGDSFSDGGELRGLYDPTKGSGARLAQSSLVNTFTNKTYAYTVLTPASWVAQAVNESEKEVLVSSATGEFFTFTLSENPNLLSARELYPDTSEIVGNGWKGGIASDGMTAVIIPSAPGGTITRPDMFLLSYNLNSQQQKNFESTFRMVVKSFSFVE